MSAVAVRIAGFLVWVDKNLVLIDKMNYINSFYSLYAIVIFHYYACNVIAFVDKAFTLTTTWRTTNVDYQQQNQAIQCSGFPSG